LFVVGHLALALQDVHGDRRLVVGGGGENLALLAGDGGVLVDQLGHHRAEGFDPQGKRGDIEEQDVLDLPLEDAALDGGADSHDLVGIDPLARGLGKDLLDPSLHRRHAGHAADQDHLVDLGRRQPGGP